MAGVLVTGAGGFLGRRLVAALLADGSLRTSGGRQTIDRLTLVDLHPVDPPPSGDVAIDVLTGDLSDPSLLRRISDTRPDSIFHLAAGLTLACERDPPNAFTANVEPARRLMEQALGKPTFVFTSSLAVFGGDLPERVGDDVALQPGTTYGVQKVIIEQLITDYSRHGLIDGRALRLPIVLTRPRSGSITPAVSDLVAAMIREPLAGEDVTVPLAAESRFPVASAGAVVRALIRLHDVEAGKLPAYRAMNLPSLTLSGRQIVDALPEFSEGRQPGRVTFRPDEAIRAIVEGWPTVLASARADALNISGDPDVRDVISDYLIQRPAA